VATLSEAYPISSLSGAAEKRRVFIPVYLAGLRKMGCFSGKKAFSMKSYLVYGYTVLYSVCAFFLMYNGVHQFCVHEDFGPAEVPFLNLA
jgi:hypothetical protein